jgi:hypothetical protein
VANRAVNITSVAPHLSTWEATSALARQGLHGMMGRRRMLLRFFMSRKAERRVRSATWQSISPSTLIDMITEVYSGDRTVCENAAKQLMFHRHCNNGCCVAIIIAMKEMFVL